MNGVCPKCGLTKDFCVCDALAKELEKIKVTGIKRRYGKFITLVEGISSDVNIKDVLKELKTRLACGGTLKSGVIELQGNHREKVREILIRLGFSAEKIEVS